MNEINWTDIQSPPPPLQEGTQTFRIASVRRYTNPNGNRCIELMLESDLGGRMPLWLSIETEHCWYIDQFFLDFLNTTCVAVVRGDRWGELVGREFEAGVDFPDRENPVLKPIGFS